MSTSKVWSQSKKYLNYMSCGLALEMIACFCNVCVTGKKIRKHDTHANNFQDGYLLTATNMTSHITCSITLLSNTISILMEYSIHIAKISMEMSIFYFKELRVKMSIKWCTVNLS